MRLYHLTLKIFLLTSHIDWNFWMIEAFEKNNVLNFEIRLITKLYTFSKNLIK